MNIGARIAAWFGGKKLPYKRRVAYLKSDGNQYINTGLIPVPDIQYKKITCRFQLVYNTNINVVFGAYNSTSASVGFCVNLRWNAVYYIRGYTSKYHNGIRDAINVVVLNKEDYTTWSVNGDEYADMTQDNTFVTQPIYLFAVNRGGVASDPTQSGIAYFGVEDVISLIPVIDNNDRPCFYDEISGSFFYNIGDGEFTWEEL